MWRGEVGTSRDGTVKGVEEERREVGVGGESEEARGHGSRH